jgi:hypothetical protein
MRLDIFLLIWLIIIVGCVLEAYFTVPYDRDFNEYKRKRDKK